MREVLKDVKINCLLYYYYYFNNIVSIFRFNKLNKQFMGYQAVNESLQWLRINASGMVKIPHINSLKVNKIDNPQPSL